MFLCERNIPIVLIVAVGTKVGEEKVRKSLQKIDYKEIDFWLCDEIGNSHFGFASRPEIWADENEYDGAKELCINLGTKIRRKEPLGFDGQGLLTVFPNNCPNNSLPILHGQSRDKDRPWKGLFPRQI